MASSALLESWWSRLEPDACEYLLANGGRDLPQWVATAVRAAWTSPPLPELRWGDGLVGKHLPDDAEDLVRDVRAGRRLTTDDA